LIDGVNWRGMCKWLFFSFTCVFQLHIQQFGPHTQPFVTYKILLVLNCQKTWKNGNVCNNVLYVTFSYVFCFLPFFWLT
jgi:hypothetical protein